MRNVEQRDSRSESILELAERRCSDPNDPINTSFAMDNESLAALDICDM